MPAAPRRLLAWGGLLALYLALLVFGLWYGRYPVTWAEILRLAAALAGTGPPPPPEVRTIVLDVRLPRLLLASLVGASLATSGAVFQGLLRNPLADPFTLGVSTGAAFGATAALFLGAGAGTALMGLGLLPLFAMAGGLAALAVVLHLARVDGTLRPATLILAGIVVSTFLSALIGLMKSLDDQGLAAIVYWMLGSVGGRGWSHVLFLLPYAAAGLALFLAYGRELDILALGDLEARHLGVPVDRVRLVLLAAACLVTAAAVSVSGVIGFVGLVAPHMVRLVQGPSHRPLLGAAALAGALMLAGSDLLAKNLLPGGEELPVGVLTTLVGGPFFCYLLKARRRQVARD
ncbi:iron ABC transporter permease [Dissulfurirhabdus thermomarina]|uniref:Iron ABC transporter permease n=2 Tax=Dissulfurirhabdus thermomarina TaxID=1765737 RepID=A0A6N9TUJ3_DISTH|nr:iron ABC transporter permease [Dissulfurirhabdus thermomarina]NDY43404.1 iron ABC transporter permease [Dissulfurirhabdus thermomarina]NMX22641.1 iron ABC transporter permease [Dissulfurirhabdus thermomarina]